MPFEQYWLDVKLACRALWRARQFSITAVFTLALGIAGTTAMFAVVQGILLRPLPVREQDRLLVAWRELPSSGFSHYDFGAAETETVRRASHLLQSVAGVTSNGVGRKVLVDSGASGYAKVALVTGGFFEVLGVDPVLGRAFNRFDDLDGAENVVVISHGLWQRRYGGSRETIGRRVRLDGQPFTVVGVMPEGLDYPRGVEVWRTTRSVPTNGPFGDAARREVDLLARLRPEVTLEQAVSELTALNHDLQAAGPPNLPRGLVPVVRSLTDVVVGDVRPALLVLFVSVALVALMASANVANLLLMRNEGRRSEFAVRAALGAGRGRLVRHLFAETLLLSFAAGVVGLAVAWWGLQGLIAIIPEGLPRVRSVRIDGIVVLFTIGLSFVTAFAAALAPAHSSMRRDAVLDLRSGASGTTGAPTRRIRRALVVAQVALAVTIVAGAGLLTRSFVGLQSVDPGLAAGRLVFVDLALPQAKYAERARHAQFLDAVMSQLEGIPEVAAVTPVNVPPFSGEGGWDVPRFAAEGQNPERAAANPALNLESVHPNYFETFEIPIVRGRPFTTTDRQGTPAVAIVSEDVAARTWPAKDPIGKRIKMGSADSGGSWLTVVGVAASTRYRDLTEPRPTLYLPAAQFQMTAQMLALRTTASVDLVASFARDAVRTIDPDVQVLRVAPFTEMLRIPLARPRFHAFLVSLFGLAALLLACIGMYGVMAAYVRQRDREIAIRKALGATGGMVRRIVLTEGLRLAAEGVLLGLLGAFLTTRVLQGLLFGVDPLDPASLAGAAVLLASASVIASLIPAWRAAHRDPIAALRAD